MGNAKIANDEKAEIMDKKDEKGVYEVENNHLVMLSILGVRDIPRK